MPAGFVDEVNELGDLAGVDEGGVGRGQGVVDLLGSVGGDVDTDPVLLVVD